MINQGGLTAKKQYLQYMGNILMEIYMLKC